MSSGPEPTRGKYEPPLVVSAGGQGGHVRFVLVEPVAAGNVGSACRAIKTMGFHQLTVVSAACDFSTEEDALRLAHGAEDVLRAIRYVDSVGDAVGDLQRVAGTTHRARAVQFSAPISIREAAESTGGRPATDSLGVVFGSERRGLTDAELALCHEVWTIPAAIAQPSLNLAQAVQVVAWELYHARMHALRQGAGDRSDSFGKGQYAPRRTPPVTAMQISAAASHMEATMMRMGFVNRHADGARFLAALTRMLSRGSFEQRDIRLVHRLLSQMDRFVARHSRVNEGGTTDSNSSV